MLQAQGPVPHIALTFSNKLYLFYYNFFLYRSLLASPSVKPMFFRKEKKKSCTVAPQTYCLLNPGKVLVVRLYSCTFRAVALPGAFPHGSVVPSERQSYRSVLQLPKSLREKIRIISVRYSLRASLLLHPMHPHRHQSIDEDDSKGILAGIPFVANHSFPRPAGSLKRLPNFSYSTTFYNVHQSMLLVIELEITLLSAAFLNCPLREV